jgi:G protein-coupled receptor Mth (Methuselah protein)
MQNSLYFSGKCLLMLSICLHASQSMFLASGHLLEHANRLWCIGSGIGVHLFYLSTIAWLTAISFDTCVTLTRMNRLDARIARSRFILYNILVWSFSISVVIISVCFQLILSENNLWSPNYGQILCLISSRYALITFFLLPIGFLILINVILFMRTIIVVHRIDRETQLARRTGGNDRSRTLLYIRLAILMGLHWIFLVVCIISKHDILWLLFDIMNSLPGLFIAIAFLRKQTSLLKIKAKFRSSQSQLSSLGTTTNAITTSSNNRCVLSSADVSPNFQMSRRLDDITQKLDKLTRYLVKPNNYLSTPSLHHSANSL